MGYPIQIENLSFSVGSDKTILREINLQIPAGAFVAVLGENGAGKTTLLDVAMGFRKPTLGSIRVDGFAPHRDPHEMRHSIAYLSEKMDLPGDWSVGDFLEFNQFFYKSYSQARAEALSIQFKVDRKARIGNLSAGEIRRIQLVAALSTDPKLIVVDEITAVLDIIGRQKFLRTLHEINKKSNCTVLLATNILEDLAAYISHVCLIANGQVRHFTTITEFLGSAEITQFSERVVALLEAG